MDADSLLMPLLELTKGLLAKGIRICSYSCDGTEVERKLQSKLTARADSSAEYSFTHPADGSMFKISIPLFDNHPVVMMQDSKHLLKTFRNNAFSGAQALILGDHYVAYHQFRDIAFPSASTGQESPSSALTAVPPLYHCDVEKVDRQDDGTATRTFLAQTLKYVTKSQPESAGLHAYLFVAGELIDACQNRAISFGE